MEAKQPDANSFFEDEYRLLPLSSQLKPTFGNGRYQLHGDETANGRGVIAYIVDTGFGVSKHDSEKSPVIADVLKNILKPQIYKNDVWPDATEELHGTAIACIVNRIVPEAQIAPLRFNFTAEKDSSPSKPLLNDCTECFKVILEHYNDLKTDKSESKPMAVVNCSWYIEDNAVGNTNTVEDVEKFRDAYHALLDVGIIVVAAAGNNNHRLKDNWERWVAAKDDQFRSSTGLLTMLDDCIVVGSFTKDFRKAKNSNYGPNVGFWAFGEGVKNPVSDLIPNKNHHKLEGTSFAAPAVTGIIAGLLSSSYYGPTLSRQTGKERQRAVKVALKEVSTAFKVGLEHNLFSEEARAFSTFKIKVRFV